MTTPHAPEGGDGIDALRADVIEMGRVLADLQYPEHPANERKRAREISIATELSDTIIAAARAEGATAERARLAGMASEEDRKMVQHYGYLATEAHRANCSGEACCEAPDRRDANKAEAEALALILARLAAARGEALEEAVRWAWANHERFHVDSEEESVRGALAALLPRGPDAATGTGVGNG